MSKTPLAVDDIESGNPYGCGVTGIRVQFTRARDGFHVPYVSDGDTEDAVVVLLGRRALSSTS